MDATERQIGDTVVLLCAEGGPALASERDLDPVIGAAFSTGARLVAIPLSRLTPDFLVLSTRVAGTMLQKLINYRFQVAILGDIDAAVAASNALRDFVVESNRGDMVWFLPNLAALEARLVR